MNDVSQLPSIERQNFLAQFIKPTIRQTIIAYMMSVPMKEVNKVDAQWLALKVDPTSKWSTQQYYWYRKQVKYMLEDEQMKKEMEDW